MRLLKTKPSQTDQNRDDWKSVDFSDTLLREELAIELKRDLAQSSFLASPTDSKVFRELENLQIMLPRAKPSS